jgi:outer membrane protein, adhesin transport system
VLESYERQFVGGRKSWLDVLNSLRELTQLEISLAESRAVAAAAYYRLRWRSDELAPKQIQVTKDTTKP